jgi:hypothetical protein
LKRHQSRSAFAVSSGPLSQRICSGALSRAGHETVEYRDGRVGVDPPFALDRERLAGELVDDVQQLRHASIGGLVELEVECPHLVGPLRGQPRGGHGRLAEPPTLPAPLRHAQALLAPEALRPLAVQAPALLPEQGKPPSWYGTDDAEKLRG